MKVRIYVHLGSERSGLSAPICKLHTDRRRGAQFRPVAHLAPFGLSRQRSVARTCVGLADAEGQADKTPTARRDTSAHLGGIVRSGRS